MSKVIVCETSSLRDAAHGQRASAATVASRAALATLAQQGVRLLASLSPSEGGKASPTPEGSCLEAALSLLACDRIADVDRNRFLQDARQRTERLAREEEMALAAGDAAFAQMNDEHESGLRWLKLDEIARVQTGKALAVTRRDALAPYPVCASDGLRSCTDAAIAEAESLMLSTDGRSLNPYWCDTPSWPLNTVYFVEPSTSSVSTAYLYFALRNPKARKVNVDSVRSHMVLIKGMRLFVAPQPFQKEFADNARRILRDNVQRQRLMGVLDLAANRLDALGETSASRP